MSSLTTSATRQRAQHGYYVHLTSTQLFHATAQVDSDFSSSPDLIDPVAPLSGSKRLTTQYTINDDVCPPTDPNVLDKTVRKNCRSLSTFLSKKPIAAHTRAAFDQIQPIVDSYSKASGSIILDSGCGTARSTVLLAETFPDKFVIGVDRSFVRLVQNAKSRGDDDEDDVAEEESDDSSAPSSSLRPYYQVIAENAIIVRAELVDFWRCILQEKRWNVEQHYLFYPNPYPTKQRLKQRFYAHPGFPLILQLRGDITVRSNWEGYLKEFAKSVEIADSYYSEEESQEDDEVNVARPYLAAAKVGPKERTDKTIGWTNFERKYDQVGEPTYELILKM